MKECPNCNRTFAPQAYDNHMAKKICEKGPRKPFEVVRVEEKAETSNPTPKTPSGGEKKKEGLSLKEAMAAGKKSNANADAEIVVYAK